jgi:hypothetical protein
MNSLQATVYSEQSKNGNNGGEVCRKIARGLVKKPYILADIVQLHLVSL